MALTADIEAQAAEWLIRQDGERWSDAQQQALDRWLDVSTAHRVAYLRLAQAWSQAGRLGALRRDAPVAAAPRRRGRGHWRLAAGLLLALGLATTGALLREPDDEAAYSAARGMRKEVELADGSRLTLNTDTRLRTTVDARQRHVWLERGEAFFEVAHDAQRPFVIEAGDQRITVLGTKFSVRLDDGHVQVQVLEGRVRMQARKGLPGQPAASAVLAGNEMALADAQQVLVAQRTAEQLSNALSWRQGRLVLDQMTLEQAAGEFNRYNRVQLIIADPALAQLRIGGSFELGNVEAFSRLLQEGFGLKVQTVGEKISISS